MTLTEAIASYESYLKAKYPRSIPTTEADKVRNSLLYMLANVNKVGDISWGGSIDDSVGMSDRALLNAVNTTRHFLICNLSTTLGEYIYLNVDRPASTSSAVAIVQPGQTVILEGQGKQEIHIIATSNSVNFTYQTGN